MQPIATVNLMLDEKSFHSIEETKKVIKKKPSKLFATQVMRTGTSPVVPYSYTYLPGIEQSQTMTNWSRNIKTNKYNPLVTKQSLIRLEDEWEMREQREA